MMSGTITQLEKRLNGRVKLHPPHAEARYGFGSLTSGVIARYGVTQSEPHEQVLEFLPEAFPDRVEAQSLREAIERQMEPFVRDPDESLPIRFRFLVNSLANRSARVQWSLVMAPTHLPAARSEEYPEKLMHALQVWAEAMLHDELSREPGTIDLGNDAARALDSHLAFIFRYGALSQWSGEAGESPLKRLQTFLALQMPESRAAFTLQFHSLKNGGTHAVRVNRIADINLSCIYKLTAFDRVEALPLSPDANVEDITMQILRKLTANSWSPDILLHRDSERASSSIRRD